MTERDLEGKDLWMAMPLFAARQTLVAFNITSAACQPIRVRVSFEYVYIKGLNMFVLHIVSNNHEITKDYLCMVRLLSWAWQCWPKEVSLVERKKKQQRFDRAEHLKFKYVIVGSKCLEIIIEKTYVLHIFLLDTIYILYCHSTNLRLNDQCMI